MELLFVLGIVVAIIAILYIHRKKDKPAVEAVVAEAAPYKVPEPPAVTTLPVVVEETTTPAPVAVVEPAPVAVEETVAIVEKPAAKPKRAKVNGKFSKDDPATPENEAWEGGVTPPKKPKAPAKPRSKKI